jgi:hypothetical protein
METNLDEIPEVPQNEQTSQEQNDSDGTSHRKTLREARLEKFEGEHTKIRRNELFSHSF